MENNRIEAMRGLAWNLKLEGQQSRSECVTEFCDELSALKQELQALREQKPYEIEWPVYHHQGMGCGLEDRNITDRYEAMRYGWDEAIQYLAQILPENIYAAPMPAREDSARLEWLEKKLFERNWNGVIDSGSRYHWSLWSGYRHIVQYMQGITFREAIDTAIISTATSKELS